MMLVLVHISEQLINPKSLVPKETENNSVPSKPVQIYFSCLWRPFSSYMV